LTSTIPAIFEQVQISLANHRKNVVALHRLHVESAAVYEETERGLRLTGEKAFNDAFQACLNRVLAIKKGVPNADRCVKFVAAYCTFAQEKFRQQQRDENVQGDETAMETDGAQDDEDEEDTPATRFVSILIRHLLRGFAAKNKNVRLRCCQTTALLVNGLESMDDELYEQLKAAFTLRLRDREAPVRVQAIIGIAKLQADSAEDLNDEEELDYMKEDTENVTALLIRALRHDPSAEVRRAALFNVLPTSQTLPYVLERLRDIDTINRRCVYLGCLSGAVLDKPDCLVKPTSEEWAMVVETGLGEREVSVVRAVKKLVASWVDSDSKKGGGGAEDLLRRFDVITVSEAARSALKAAFEVRPLLLDTVSMDERFWQDLTPEKALIARVFAEHCKTLGVQGEKRMEETLPLVTALAFRSQAAWGSLLEALEVSDEVRTEEEEAELGARTEANRLTVESLLHVSMHLDYGDEIGRRKMFGLVRDMVSNALLPDSLMEPCLDVLRKLSAGQKDFVRIVVELVQEIDNVIEPELMQRGGEEEDEEEEEDQEEDEAAIEDQLFNNGANVRTSPSKKGSRESPDPELAEQQASIDIRRLSIIGGMLERIIVGGAQENVAMHGLVAQLILPAVRSKDATVRTRGLRCLGLFGILDPALALSTFPTFLEQTNRSSGSIRQTSFEVIFDLLLTHGITFLCQAQIEQAGGDQAAIEHANNEILGFLLGLLEDDDYKVQSIAAEGMAKLMLSGIVNHDEAIRCLTLVYMSPETSDNQELRQCLSYFLPIYCFSSAANQRRLQRVLMDVLGVLTEVYYDRDVDQEMVPPLQIGQQLLDWCDPLKGAYVDKTDVTIHLDAAIELVQSLFVKETKEDRKVACQLLGRIALPEEDALMNGKVDESAVVLSLFVLIGTLQRARPLDDALSRNALVKFVTACKRLYPTAWNTVCSMDIHQASELDGVRAFVQECGYDLIKMLDNGDDGITLLPSPRKPSGVGSSRRTISAATSRSASGTNSRKASVGSVSNRRTTRVKIEDEGEGLSLEQSIVEGFEDDENNDGSGEEDGRSRLVAALSMDDFDSL
jgi:condensin complex subunit 3